MAIKFGLVIFMLLAGMAFWILIFLASLIPGWIGLNLKEYLEENVLKNKNPFEGRD
ncbi:MAG: hypothetical protein HOH13_09710 [Crocinitomicaceae bacterium]|jgi:hypothetical protein|nr:hypothetical protein [Crocinitomicaceae bacterium]MBT5403249.1 hypothetical protein [Crocinitomicaceae bacterium]MBT6030572.1 hypothetical protein [Crocinitomicaceae bacterium]MBT6513830.1 hypothetical protein [Crocinitomicaceae bacterium]MDG2331658.1 hypothetical protein [Flavobacteriales bacterium]